ncbi:dTDP-4-dehydrorhamnose 3,5-epimerase [Escherichia coli]|uniref:dTDP-4-dehydrorhamnose 3,5-epimerase n=1 Tax=Escherichia TaxID=561 RepID=UPI0000F0B304|nr:MULTISPECIES: dTDP-4-dehydrorhamnose 3,5-epimerase [Escherichia]MCI7296520.1 dTDP-4-dehydrorhamnose 3,5-epimerase [Shigella dysenteriae]MEC9534910.1 dTDP-4-dehydrorhamnose 3,5-epimerase [Escherichia marmotae]ACA77263.1 dTDP-4-dehydrorhamnose 3,5-epimerase [Escherichia coli ATCC 8739]AYB97332.1 dTDP-4-dehydrorhamnose 3,5-epimerase [Escherichia coli ATCC 8739]EEZ5315643.1 dTDP-4-dehydrorhamnose 3,5-epimerase [Escherichia coli]
MNVIKTEIPEVLIFEPKKFEDSRGYFFESFNQRLFEDAVGKEILFVQDNQSYSSKNVLRGLHYQSEPYAQGKLVRCIMGEVFDVAVDIRKESESYGQWVGVFLSEDNNRQLWIPEGFAHGFLVKSDKAIFAYKCTNFYNPSAENTIRWDSPDLAIEWPLDDEDLLISEKDLLGRKFL